MLLVVGPAPSPDPDNPLARSLKIQNTELLSRPRYYLEKQRVDARLPCITAKDINVDHAICTNLFLWL